MPGSPKFVTFPSQAVLEARRDSPPFVNPDLSLWPNGLMGSIDSLDKEITQGLTIVTTDKAAGGTFMVSEPRLVGNRSVGFYGVRVETVNRGPLWIHHRFSPGGVIGLRKRVDLSIEISLGESEGPMSQKPVEIWLTRRTADSWEKVRRVGRGRVFRRATLVSFSLTPTAEEVKLLQARVLSLGVLVDSCRALRLYPARVVRVQADRSQGFSGFEDLRLAEAFASCGELANAHGNQDLFAKVLPPQVSSTTSVGQVDVAHISSENETTYPFTQIIVPVYNGDSVVVECLRSIQSCTTTPYQVIVINDGSRRYTTDAIRNFVATDPRFIIHDREENKGYTKSINEAVKLTGASWIVILNSDTVVTRGWLRKLHDAAISREDVGMVGPLSNAASWQSLPNVKEPNGSWSANPFIGAEDAERVQGELDQVSERRYPVFPLLNGFCTLIRQDVLTRCGFYDEDAFPIGYGEETDLCLRVAKAGFSLVIADDCFVYHRKSVSFGTKGRESLAKEGFLELTNKHSGVQIAALEQMMQTDPTLTALRRRMSKLRYWASEQ